MFLHTKLENQKNPIKICFIGCGKFVSMFLAQYNHLDKIQIDTIVDINIDQAKKNCLKSGLSEKTVKEINFSSSLDEAFNRNIEIFIEATGNPIVGTVHATKIIKNKKLANNSKQNDDFKNVSLNSFWKMQFEDQKTNDDLKILKTNLHRLT